MGTSYQGFGCWGTDHTHASLEVMEKLCFDSEAIRDFWKAHIHVSPIQELVVLSTCNRVECYFFAQDLDIAKEWLLEAWAKFKGVDFHLMMHTLQFRSNEAVVTHLFRVVSGIESMVFGENEILAQVKDALAICHRLGTTGALLNKLFQVAVATGKRVRKETLIGRGAYSISSIAVEGIKEAISNFLETPLLVVGAGTMALRAIKKLVALGHTRLSISNRSEEKLLRLADKYGLTIVPYSQLRQQVSRFPIVLVATASSTYILEPSMFLAGHQTAIIVDLSVPRNVDPEIHKGGVKLITVENLKAIADRTIESRKQELSHIQLIIENEKQDFKKWVLFKQGLWHPQFA